jgi:anti-sigma factor RsiW
MMDYQQQLRLQAYLDGELSTAEAKEIADLLGKDQEAAALDIELRQTSQALAGFEEGVKLPESREFFWSKVKRGIESQQTLAETIERANASARPATWSERLRQFLMPAAGLAVIALLALIVNKESGPSNPPVETSLADGGGVVYHDFSAGATFVWLSYPPDSDSSEEDDAGSLD